MSRRCRLGWHDWSIWTTGANFRDCFRCGKRERGHRGNPKSLPVDIFSEQSTERVRAAMAKDARGETIGYQDLLGILEPNPDLPNCQSWNTDSQVPCSLPNHHEGLHRAEVTWS